MAVYTVHLPPQPADLGDIAEKTAFIPEGFSFAAYAYGPLWLLWQRLWLALGVWVVIAVVYGFAANALKLPVLAHLALFEMAQIFIGLEANNLRRSALARSGFELADVVTGSKRVDAEHSFFHRFIETRPVEVPIAPLPPSKPTSGPVRPMDTEVLGLFSDIGGRK
jgi:hypothetical protein